MKFLKIFIIIVFTTLLNNCSVLKTYKPPPQTAKYIDEDKFIGKWYEIAGIPGLRSSGCTCTSSTYLKSKTKNKFTVLNRCFLSSKHYWDNGKGTANILPNTNNTKLKVTFLWPFYFDMWILYASDNYQTSIIGSPNYKNLYISSRKPKISEKEFDKLIKIAKQKGYDTSLLRKTKQNCHNS
jgi:apolipoprotein D and lipocalin family protein